jgi:hypothetical protein
MSYLHRGLVHCCHICTRTRLIPARSVPGPDSSATCAPRTGLIPTIPALGLGAIFARTGHISANLVPNLPRDRVPPATPGCSYALAFVQSLLAPFLSADRVFCDHRTRRLVPCLCRPSPVAEACSPFLPSVRLHLLWTTARLIFCAQLAGRFAGSAD